MNTPRYLILIVTLLVSAAVVRAASADLILVAGAPGSDEFAPGIEKAVDAWEEAGRAGEATIHVIGRTATGKDGDLRRLEELVPTLARREGPPLWIVLVGHGTFDRREAKFNLRDRDLAASALAGWLEDARRPVVVINGSSASAPFLKTLSGPGRIVVTATKSGAEDSYARFGEFLARQINSPEADRDQDGGTSLLEGFLAASAAVNEFYEQQGRLRTEEALLDDNGDQLGTPAGWFRGIRAIRTAKEGAQPDGRRAHQLHLVPSPEERSLDPATRRRRNALEEELFALRQRKNEMPEEEYFQELEHIVRELADIYAPVAVPEDDDS